MVLNKISKLKIKNIHNIKSLDENDLIEKASFEKDDEISGKYILKESMFNILPKEIIQLKKQGFSSPDASWFKGESIDFVKTKLKNSNARIYNYLDFNSVSNLIDEHLSGQCNRRLLIWSLLKVFNSPLKVKKSTDMIELAISCS